MVPWKKYWKFFWDDNSTWSWILNIVVFFILIKFLLYPGFGLIVGTSYPVVAVMSESMDHSFLQLTTKPELCGKFRENTGYVSMDDYWALCSDWYFENTNITFEKWKEYSFNKGFSKGDIMFISGRKPEKINIGDIIVFKAQGDYPIIHRVINKSFEEGQYVYATKGDHNSGSSPWVHENHITEDRIMGVAYFRLPYLGYIKLAFAWFLGLFGLQVI